MTLDVTKFLDIENSLSNVLASAWGPYISKVETKFVACLEEKDWDAAVRVINAINLDGIADSANEDFALYSLAALKFGASRVLNLSAKESADLTQLTDQVRNAIRISKAIITQNMTKLLKDKLKAVVTELQAAETQGSTVVKGDLLKPFTTFDPAKMGDGLLQLVSSLHTSRLASLGYVVEAEYQGITNYAINAQLDKRVCPVCRVMHGRIFSVKDARAFLDKILYVSDPDELKTLQPWPTHGEDTVKDLVNSSASDLTSRGLHIPPYHAGCRCIVVKTSDVPSIEQTASFQAAVVENPALLKYQPNKWDFTALGLPNTEEVLSLWANSTKVSPRQIIGDLIGENKNLMSADYFKSNKIKASITDGELKVTAPSITLDGMDRTGGVSFIYSLTTGMGELEWLDTSSGNDFRTLFRNLVSILSEAGAKTLRAPISSATEGVLWAKSGFLPVQEDWNYATKVIQKNLKALDIPDAKKQVVERLLATNDPKALWLIMEIGDQQVCERLLKGVKVPMLLNFNDLTALSKFSVYF